LTARNSKIDALTKKQLNNIGLKSNTFDIHCTDNIITKGEYIQKNIDLSECNIYIRQGYKSMFSH
jgi:hypothetical protein